MCRFHDLPLAHNNNCQPDWSFFQRQTHDSYRIMKELMHVFCMAGVHQQPELSNYLAEGQILT